MNTIQFPAGFRWGTATSSFQIEGAAELRAPSIWDDFCLVPGAIADGSDGLVAVDHYNRYGEDVDLMASLHLDTYRFSVSWPRVINPDGSTNAEGVGFYDRLVDRLCTGVVRDAGIGDVDGDAFERNGLAVAGLADADDQGRVVFPYQVHQLFERDVEDGGQFGADDGMARDLFALQGLDGLPAGVEGFAAKRGETGQQDGGPRGCTMGYRCEPALLGARRNGFS